MAVPRAAAATTRAPAPTPSTGGSTSPCRSGTAPGPRGSTPGRSPRRVDPRCSRSRCRSRGHVTKPYAICHGAQPWQIAGLVSDPSNEPMFALLSLGFTLSLDNFRTSIVLGGLKPTLLRSVKTSFDLRPVGWRRSAGRDPRRPLPERQDQLHRRHHRGDRPRCLRPVRRRQGVGVTRACGPGSALRDARAAATAERRQRGRRRGPWHRWVLSLARATRVRNHHVCDVGRRAPDRPHSGPLHTPHPHRPVDWDRVRRDGGLPVSWHQPPGRTDAGAHRACGPRDSRRRVPYADTATADRVRVPSPPSATAALAVTRW